MIEQKQSEAVILQDGENIQESIKMSLDLESAKEIMQILSKNLYSDAIGSTIRETASNALDSHRVAGVTDKPIIVFFGKNNSGNYEFSVEDFGVGLDHEDVESVISKYGKSTKKNSNIELGMFGLGWKSPLAYVSSFTFIARKDGVERKYIMSEGEEENVIDLIDESPTDKSNGVKVIVPVNYYDASSFYNKIREQLCYFESVYFDVNYNGTIDNNFKITRWDDFQMSELTNDSNLHLCLDNVYYPLDFKKLGIDSISIPIGLRFGLSDGIYPTPNRESIRYSTEAKAIILKKIETVASQLVEMYNKSVEDCDDFTKIVDYYSGSGRFIDVGHKQHVDITNLIKYSTVKIKQPVLKGVSLLDIKKLAEDRNEMFSEYFIKYCIGYNGRVKEEKYNHHIQYGNLINSNYSFYLFSDKLGGVKKEYIKSIKSTSNVYFIKKIRTRTLSVDSEKKMYYDEGTVCYRNLLELDSHPKSEWRARIKEFQGIKESLEKKIIDCDALVIPKAWLDNRKLQKVSIKLKKNGHQKIKGEISCKRAEPLERYVHGKSCKFTPYSLNLEKIGTTNMLYIYTSHENANNLDKFYELSRKHTRIFITFSERELKRVGEFDIHNLISYEEFMKGKTTTFKRIITSYLIHILKEKNKNVFDNIEDIANISSILSSKLNKIDEYADKWYNRYGTSEIYEVMLEVAKEHSLFDYSVYNDYLEVKETLEKFPFLQTIYNHIRYSSDERTRIVTDLLKYNKYRINTDKYEKKETNEIINN